MSTLIVVLDLGQLVGAEDGLVVEEPIEFKGELERWDVDVEFCIDSILPIEVELQRRIQDRKLLFQPHFQL